MAASYPTAIITEYHNGSAWVDISAYVVGDIKGSSGFTTSNPDDRVGGLGLLELELNNAGKLFTVYGGDAVRGLPTLTGWRKGAPVRVTVEFGSRSTPYFVGRLADVKSDGDVVGPRRAHALCTDWFDVATRFPMRGSEILLNKTIDQAAAAMLARVSVQPTATDFDAGKETFPAVFSNVKEKSKAISELTKLAASELGYVYVEKDGTLRIENAAARPGTRTLDKVPVHPDLWDILELADGDTFELADGDTLLLEEAEEAAISTTPEHLDIEEKGEIINAAYVKAYPVRTDTALGVVASLGSAVKIAEGSTAAFSIRYTNPDGREPISATNLQAPVATTDYLFNTAADGSGSNITSDLTVTPTYYGDQVDYILTSAYGGEGYVTKLQARGYGIYFDSPISMYISDQDSIDADGDTAIELNQVYKRNLYAGQAFGRSVVEEYKTSKARVKRARFLANISPAQLMACSYLDVGSLLKVYDNRSELYKWYYITGRNFVITLGRVIHVTFALIEAVSILSGALVPIPLDFGGSDWGTINYGFCPRVAGLAQRSISVKVTPRTVAGRLLYTISDTSGGGFSFALGGTNRLQLYLKGNVNVGAWDTPDNSITANVEHTLIVTHDRSTDINADPIIYIDGAAVTLTETSTPVNTAIHSEEGLPLQIGSYPSDGPIEDVRVYDRILTPAEVTALTNGAPYADIVTDGLVFQSHCLNSDYGEAADFTDGILPDGANTIDNIFKMVGEPVVPGLSVRTWTLRTTPNNNYNAVAWGNGVYVAVGNTAGTTTHVMTSPNGRHWTAQTTTDVSLFAVAYSDTLGLFVAVGNNAILTSPDGTTWTPRTSPANRNWRGVVYGGGKFVAVANYNAGTTSTDYATSTDGISWATGAVQSGTNLNLSDICYSEELGLFVAVANSGVSIAPIYVSANGTSWAAHGPSGRNKYGVTWSPALGLFVATGDGSDATNTIHTSTNGTTWTARTAPSAKTWVGVTWSEELGVFMAVANNGTGNRSITSANGTSWAHVATPADYGWTAIGYSADLQRFVAVQDDTSNTTRAMTY